MEIIRILLANEGKLRAFATIIVDHCLCIRDAKIVEGPKGLFVAKPYKKLKDGTYLNLVYPVNAETREIRECAVIVEYKKSGGPTIHEYVLSKGGSYETATATDSRQGRFWL